MGCFGTLICRTKTQRLGDQPVVFQVIDWIENHGEAFLSKHTGVGKSLHRARALQKRHDDFEDVAQVRRSPAPLLWSQQGVLK